jgi:hypothetical protein
VCNLYSITTNQAAIIALFRVMNRYVGNLPPMPGVFPDYPEPVVRNAGTERELVMMRWGMPPPRAGGKRVDTFVARRPVSCLPISLDQYGRIVATCLGDGVDLGDRLVRNGLALDWPQYSRGKYGAAQREAEQAGRGIWKGSYVEPWLYRVCIRHRQSGPLPAEKPLFQRFKNESLGI